MTPGDIEVFLPVVREDDFQNVLSLMDKSFQAKYQVSGTGESIFLTSARAANSPTKFL